MYLCMHACQFELCWHVLLTPLLHVINRLGTFKASSYIQYRPLGPGSWCVDKAEAASLLGDSSVAQALKA